MIERRRLFFGLAVVATVASLGGMMVVTLSPGGFGLLDVLLTGCFVVTLPWTVVGFWNAVIGFSIMRLHPDPSRYVCPVVADAADLGPIRGSTAILVCIRNEDVRSVGRNLDVLIEGLVNAGVRDRFHVYLLSDSTWEEVVAAEEALCEHLAVRWRGILPMTYRRREENAGFKAGNIRDFCDRWAGEHDYALVLDADSVMSTEAVLRMVRTLERNPRLGILQSLVVGMPTVSGFARLFQFGMRLAMRSYTLGSAWWQADCGPYWGHNAMIRLPPFVRHCRLPRLPGKPPLGGWILSHDQVEAALMRRAGYEVRVLPVEEGSWEENPPTLLEFIRRDLRWCHGNMQYWRLLALPGLLPVSRVQLLLAILMFLNSPAWIAFMTIGLVCLGLPGGSPIAFQPDTGVILLAAILTMVFAPKLATTFDVLATPRSRRAFGGPAAIVPSVIGEVLFFTLLAPVMALAHTRFLVGLAFGRAANWSAQRRFSHRVGWGQAWRRLWLPSVFGVAAIVWVVFSAPAALLGFLPFVVGSALAVPLAVLTSGERLGLLFARAGLWRIPDEIAPPPELKALQLPALTRYRPVLAGSEAAPGSVSGESS
jgi:membrane glycosyltransferase